MRFWIIFLDYYIGFITWIYLKKKVGDLFLYFLLLKKKQQPFIMNFEIEEENVLLFKTTKVENNSKTNINEFIELLLDEGPFEYLFEKIVGCSTFNYYKEIFSVTFKSDIKQDYLEKLLKNFETPQECINKNGEKFNIQLNRPNKSQQMVTLYPMTHNIQPNQIQQMTKSWGKLESYRFGRHRRCPLLLNNYLHIFLTDFKKEMVPDLIKINNRSVTIQIQGEELYERCAYCKERNHIIENCPHKPKPRTESTNSYADKVKNTSNPKPIIQHIPYHTQTDFFHRANIKTPYLSAKK